MYYEKGRKNIVEVRQLTRNKNRFSKLAEDPTSLNINGKVKDKEEVKYDLNWVTSRWNRPTVQSI